jgi:hypothetical protein
MSRPPALLLSATVCLAACTGSLPHSDETTVLHALGPRDGFISPLVEPLRPACPALVFPATRYSLSTIHQGLLCEFMATLPADRSNLRLLIVGQTPLDLPGAHARALSERRAQAVRRFLIDQGLPAEQLQTLGLGHDAASAGHTGNSVVLYRQ